MDFCFFSANEMKEGDPVIRKLKFVAVFVAVSCIGADARAESIAVNFMAEAWGGGPFPIGAAEEAGYFPQINWNNTNPISNGTTADVAGPLPGKLVDNAGVDSGAGIAWFNANQPVGSDGGNTTPNERLYKGLIEGPAFGPTWPQLTFTVSDVPYETYDVYAYLVGFGFNAEASARIGGEEYFYTQSSNFTTDGFIRATSTVLEEYPPLATYALFEDVTGDSFSLEIIKRDGNRGGLGGLQIVKVPEPGSITLLVCGLAAGLIWWRRKR